MTDNTHLTNRLLPCPFCGHEHEFPPYIAKELGDYIVRCGVCGASGSYRSIEAQAVEAWNTRSNPSE